MSRYKQGLRFDFQNRSDRVSGDEEDAASDFGFGIDPEWPRFYRHILITARDTVALPDATTLMQIVGRLIKLTDPLWPESGPVTYGYLSDSFHIFYDAIPEEMWEAFKVRPDEEKDHPPPPFVVTTRDLRKQTLALDQEDPKKFVTEDVANSAWRILVAWGKAMDASREDDTPLWIEIIAPAAKYGIWFAKGVEKTIKEVGKAAAKPITDVWDIFKKVLLFTGIAIGGVLTIMVAGSLRGRGGGGERSLPAAESPRPRSKAESQAARVAQRIKEKSK